MRSHQAEAPVRECGAKDQVSRAGAPAKGRKDSAVNVRGRLRVAGVAMVGAVAMAAVALALTGCDEPAAIEPMKPQVTPPAIKQAGVLRAGVDLSYPPFAGVEQAKMAGIDVEVASALAGRLGLEVEFVDVKASQVATALAQDDVDVALSAPFSADVVTRATIAGTYLSDGPVLYGARSLSPSATIDSVLATDDIPIGVQVGSEAYWLVTAERGLDGVKVYPTLREAFDALDRREVQAVACDAVVGAYIGRDRPGVRYVGMLGPTHLLGVAVSARDSRLADTLRTTLDKLVSDGAVDAIRRAWVGQLPKLPPPSIDAAEDGSSVPTLP